MDRFSTKDSNWAQSLFGDPLWIIPQKINNYYCWSAVSANHHATWYFVLSCLNFRCIVNINLLTYSDQEQMEKRSERGHHRWESLLLSPVEEASKRFVFSLSLLCPLFLAVPSSLVQCRRLRTTLLFSAAWIYFFFFTKLGFILF